MRLAPWTFARKRNLTLFKDRKGRLSSIFRRPATMWLVVPILIGRADKPGKPPKCRQVPHNVKSVFPAPMDAKAQVRRLGRPVASASRTSGAEDRASDLCWRRPSLSNKSWSGSDNVMFSTKSCRLSSISNLAGLLLFWRTKNKDWTLNRGRDQRVAARTAKQKTGISNGRYSVVWRSVFIF